MIKKIKFECTDKPTDKTNTTWNIQFKLIRPNHLRYEFDNKTIADDSLFDKKHIKSEITTWLEDLDYRVKKIKIKKE